VDLEPKPLGPAEPRRYLRVSIMLVVGNEIYEGYGFGFGVDVTLVLSERAKSFESGVGV